MDLARTLNDHLDEITSVEIIPSYLLPPQFEKQGWCLIDGVLGIVNKTLAVNYVKLCVKQDEISSPQTSLVSLLATNDNLKVLNARKRMCISGEINPKDELRIVTVLLKSHLYKHSKSSMLWHHRRWLLTSFDFETTMETEYLIVEQAAQHHPKNYYAWGYLRWWCDQNQIRSNSTEFDRLCQCVKQLCLQNLGDVSMWTFLHWLNSEELEELATTTSDQFPGHEAILSATRSSSN